MRTTREAIIDTLVLKMQADPDIGIGVIRSRVQAFSRAELPVVVVDPVSDSPDQSVLGVITWTMQLRVAVVVMGLVPDMIADEYVNAIHRCLMSDQSLGGLIMDIGPAGVKFDLYEADQPRGLIQLTYSVQYRTADADLSQAR